MGLVIGKLVHGLLDEQYAQVNKSFLPQEMLGRLGIDRYTTDPEDFSFIKISDNGANMKAAWTVEDDQWVPCYDHTLELCTLPFTWVEKRKGQEVAAPKGSIAQSVGRVVAGSTANEFRR